MNHRGLSGVAEFEPAMRPFFPSKPKTDGIKETVANALHDVAEKVDDTSTRVARMSRHIRHYGHQAASWLDRSAEYVEHIDGRQVRTKIEDRIRLHPTRNVLIAGAVGLAVGALLRRR